MGLDLHKRVLEVCILDQAGHVEDRLRLLVDRDSLLKFAQRELRPDDHLAVEATTNTWPVVALLRPHVDDITVSNPMATKAIAYAKVKTDKIDAQTLARLLRADFLPSDWQPDVQTGRLRQLTNQRVSCLRPYQHQEPYPSVVASAPHSATARSPFRRARASVARRVGDRR